VLVAVYALASGEPIYKQIMLWFMNPNVLGYVLYTSIPMYIAAGQELTSNRRLFVLFSSIMLIGLLISSHRTSWLAATVSMAFLAWKSRIKMFMWVGLIAALFSVSLLIPILGENVYEYVTGPRYTGRNEIWTAALRLASDYPLFGVGAGNSTNILPVYIDLPWARGAVDTHSVYLRNAAEMGLTSVAIWLAVYVIFFYFAEKTERELKSDYLKCVTRGVTATFFGLLVHGFFENGYFLTPSVAAEFHALIPYIFMALPFAAKRLESSADK
jgi:O-antigen ligase